MAGRTAWILGNRLSHDSPALTGADRVLMVESRAGLGARRYHRQKLHLILSAMRHFAHELRERGVEVDYRSAATLEAGLAEHRKEHSPYEVALFEPTSLEAERRLGALDGVRIVPGTLFLTTPDEFAEWTRDRRRFLMEDFYRWQRRRLDVLMDGREPAGGRWNLDAENRRPAPKHERPPAPWLPQEDGIDAAVRRDLDALGAATFGSDSPRLWPATAAEARNVLDDFVAERLPDFGPWQDTMLAGERWMWHSRLSAPLNLGLISPLECVEAAEDAYRSGRVPLASAEGFIRQVIGWREYVWGMYWLHADRWPADNALEADTPLPQALWGGPTEMRCVADTVSGLADTAYAHHIERLMVFGNLILLLGVRPDEALDWFHAAYIDGYHWVMAPNVIGMATFADGGRMMSKPYAASGRYIDRMSDHCGRCRYDPGKRTGDDACPYTTLYWDFLDRNRKRLSDNRRMTFMYRTLERFPLDEMNEIRDRARDLREDFNA